MRKLTTSVVTGLAGAAMVAAAMQQPASAAPVAHDGATAGQAKAAANRPDNRPGPVTKKQLALREAAVQKVAAGDATPNADGVVKLGSDKFAEVETTKNDKIFTILAEFGDQSVNKYGTAPGPLHNQIAPPDRELDNSTTWTQDYNKAYYENLFNGSGESMKTFYEALSNGQYSVTNTVSGLGEGPLQRVLLRRQRHRGLRRLVGVHRGRRQRLVRGRPGEDGQQGCRRGLPQAVRRLGPQRLRQRRQLRRADGYIDHFQAVHAGQGEDAGGGAQGADAIWSHRWYVNGDDYGVTGPTRQPNGRRHADRRLEASGWATTPRSRRTVASVCSRTSTATTSACRTTTTPPAARTAPRSGP